MLTFGGWAACQAWATSAAGMLGLRGRAKVGPSNALMVGKRGFGPDSGQQRQTGAPWPPPSSGAQACAAAPRRGAVVLADFSHGPAPPALWLFVETVPPLCRADRSASPSAGGGGGGHALRAPSERERPPAGAGRAEPPSWARCGGCPVRAPRHFLSLSLRLCNLTLQRARRGRVIRTDPGPTPGPPPALCKTGPAVQASVSPSAPWR